MAIVRCPQCGRVADGVACFACGYEWDGDGAGSAPEPSPAAAAVAPPASAPPTPGQAPREPTPAESAPDIEAIEEGLGDGSAGSPLPDNFNPAPERSLDAAPNPVTGVNKPNPFAARPPSEDGSARPPSSDGMPGGNPFAAAGPNPGANPFAAAAPANPFAAAPRSNPFDNVPTSREEAEDDATVKLSVAPSIDEDPAAPVAPTPATGRDPAAMPAENPFASVDGGAAALPPNAKADAAPMARGEDFDPFGGVTTDGGGGPPPMPLDVGMSDDDPEGEAAGIVPWEDETTNEGGEKWDPPTEPTPAQPSTPPPPPAPTTTSLLDDFDEPSGDATNDDGIAPRLAARAAPSLSASGGLLADNPTDDNRGRPMLGDEPTVDMEMSPAMRAGQLPEVKLSKRLFDLSKRLDLEGRGDDAMLLRDAATLLAGLGH